MMTSGSGSARNDCLVSETSGTLFESWEVRVVASDSVSSRLVDLVASVGDEIIDDGVGTSEFGRFVCSPSCACGL